MAVCTFKYLYEPLFFNHARYYDLLGGRGRGGSYTGTDYFLHKITRNKYFRGYFVRQTFADIRDSLFRDFKDRIQENRSVKIEDFNINESEMRIIYKPNMNMIISRGVKKDGSRTAKLKSLAGATDVLIEEADELGEEDFDVMDLSLRTVKGEGLKIIRVFNPPHKQHWIWRDYNLIDATAPDDWPKGEKFPYYQAIPKKDADLISIFSTYHDNIKFLDEGTVKRFESFKERKPEYYYTVVKGLVSEGQKGRIFSGWQTITDEEFNAIPARSIFGQDFGSSSPAATAEIKVVNNKMYIREQNYTPLGVKEIAILYCKLGVKDNIIIADSAEPHSISRLRRGWERKDLTEEEATKYPQLIKGFNIFPAIKGVGSVIDGIDVVKESEVFMTEGSKNGWHEYREYKWALDKNKNPTDEPEDNNNHLMDCVRYVRKSKGRHY